MISFGGDSPRFKMDVIHHNSMCGYVVDESTEEHLGPGTYFSPDKDDKRGGWASKSFAKSQPMSPSVQNRTRTFVYADATLETSGIALPTHPDNRATPGPGQYSQSIFSQHQSSFANASSPGGGSPNVETFRGRSLSNGTFGALNATSPGANVSGGTAASRPCTKLLSPGTVLRDGVLFHKTEPDLPAGPGQYTVFENWVKKSHNVRASSGGSSSHSIPGSPRPQNPHVGEASPRGDRSYRRPGSYPFPRSSPYGMSSPYVAMNTQSRGGSAGGGSGPSSQYLQQQWHDQYASPEKRSGNGDDGVVAAGSALSPIPHNSHSDQGYGASYGYGYAYNGGYEAPTANVPHGITISSPGANPAVSSL